MQMQNLSFVIVIDEHSYMSGMVSEETLLSAITASLDKKNNQTKEYTLSQDNTLITTSELSINEINKIFQTNLTSQYGMVTIGGWLIEQLGTIPQTGATLQKGQFFFRVLAADSVKIKKIHIKRLTNTDVE